MISDVISEKTAINGKQDDGGIHALGNGRLCIYEHGPQIVQVFAPYSAPSFMQMLPVLDSQTQTHSQREFGAAIWDHILKKNNNAIGSMTDFVDSSLPCFVRQMQLTQARQFDLLFSEGVEVVPNAARFSKYGIAAGLLATMPPGKFILHKYPIQYEQNYQILVKGDCDLEQTGKGTWRLTVKPGLSALYICGGPSYPECVNAVEMALAVPYSQLLSTTRTYWKEFASKRFDFEKKFASNLPLRQELLQAIDDAAVMIKTQQGSDGGVLAGHAYHLAYVRDQYGVFRCLMSLGYYDEAKAIIKRYWQIWQQYHRIHNAQGIGVEGVFHVHENDHVEITAYLIIQVFDYAARAADGIELLQEVEPMLKWAFEVQTQHLVNGMLPFNGDETYVAGGILPRSTLNDGSAEATLLFITGAERLLPWVEQNQVWPADEIAKAKEILNRMKAVYFENFWDDGELITNNPLRAQMAELPRFRHGVCEATVAFGWTERNENDRYVCPAALLTNLPAAEKKKFRLKSVSLMPLYIGATLIPTERLAKNISAIAENYKTNGRLPSTPDGSRTVGYDYGLLLYSLTKIGHPLAAYAYEKTLRQTDCTGVWVEYYDAERPSGTRYRPWESGINLEAAIEFALKYSAQQTNL